MAINPNEFTALIKAKIRSFQEQSVSGDVGVVIKVGDGIAFVYGLNQAMAGELIIFPRNIVGMAMNLEEECIGVILLNDDLSIKEGTEAWRSKRIIEVPVGDALLGRVVNALGQPLDGGGKIEATSMRPIERVAPGIMTRQSVNRPLQTGILALDAMIPIGRGQRELIIGDRQTGKTALALDTIINQKGRGVKCIYVAIGQKNATVARLVDKLSQHGALEYTTVVAATASEPAPLQYIAPYTGCAIGEAWMENGEDVLIVYDDLSKHAVSYRTLSLLLRRPPGREAYPGDVFYLHSRLLERSACLAPEYGGGSLTSLPIVETQAGDISAYIPTNVISITDGQIFLQNELFNSGQRPAIDSGLSVSRVGSSAQCRGIKRLAGSLKIDLANYRELLSFAQFGSDLDEATRLVLEKGERVMEMMKQMQYAPYQVWEEIVLLFMIKQNMIASLHPHQIKAFNKFLLSHLKGQESELVAGIEKEQDLTPAVAETLTALIKEYLRQFRLRHG